jgi:hypothetical protein
MREVQATGGVATRTRRADRPTGQTVEHNGSEGDPGDLPEHWLVEIDHLASRIHADHDEVPLATVTVLVREAYASMLGARVQVFRAILAERRVRRHLGALDGSTH